MRYTIPFELHGKKNFITVDYEAMTDPRASGFHILNLPFPPEKCIGYPMLHAHFENLTLTGYERYCGFIQIIKREEFTDLSAEIPCRTLFELDVPDDFREMGFPYFALGYPAELFDAPCNNLRGAEKLIWRAYTYLVDIPTRINDYKLGFLAGFSWGYTENTRGEVSLLDFHTLTEDNWRAHKKYAGIHM